MKLRHLYAALAAASIASVASAAEFTGLGIDAEIQFKSTGGDSNVSSTGYGTSQISTSSIGGEHTFAGALGLNYGFLVAPRWVVQLGMKADLTEDAAMNVANTTAGDFYTAYSWAKLDEKRHYSLHIQPGYLIHAGTMVYAKLSFHRMTLDGSQGAQVITDGGTSRGSRHLGSTFKGIGFGFGIQALFSKNMYGYAEINHVQYGEESIGKPLNPGYVGSWDLKPRTTSGALGIGWRF